MDAPLDELYLQWLYGKVASPRARSPRRTYWSLLRQLYMKEFVWFIPNDDNRVEDGRDLRFEFAQECNLPDLDVNWQGLGCSLLEMLIALSRRLAFEAEGEAHIWFWHLLRNLGLSDYNDATPGDPEDVEEVLDTLIWRTYSYDGRGGLFPLERAETDQRETEIWYQLNAYLLDLA
jgi:hypothetical protein